MRTQQEILDRIADLGYHWHSDTTEIRRRTLASELVFDNAKRFYTDLDPDHWLPPYDYEQLRDSLGETIVRALNHADKHAAATLMLDVDQMAEYLWLMGESTEEFYDAPWSKFATPKIMVAARIAKVDLPDDDWLLRMSVGEKCKIGCRRGCAK